MTTEATAAVDLAGVEELRRRKREGVAGVHPGISRRSEYPCTVEVECVCLRPGCGRAFRVPVAHLAKDRPVGRVPDRCPGCVAWAETLAAEQIRQEQEEAARLARAVTAQDVLALVEQSGGNPYEYAEHTLETFGAKPGREKALTAVREWVATVLSTRDRYARVRGLYLVGETGTGKTALAHCALRALLEAGMEPRRGVLFDDSLTLIERIQGTYGSNDSTWALLEERISARVWILDDIMAEKPTPDVVRKLTLLFNRREGRPTIVTSNENPSRLTEANPEYFRLASRFGPAHFRVVRAGGEDARFDRPDVRRVAAI